MRTNQPSKNELIAPPKGLTCALGRCSRCAVVAAGARLQVRTGGSQASPYIDDLKKAEESAQAGGVGVWTKVRANAPCLAGASMCIGIARPGVVGL